MNILRYLFWFKDNEVTAVRCDSKGMSIDKFDGKLTVPFDDTYWQEWKEYSGMESGNKVDFCCIYDQKPTIKEELEAAQCDDKEAAWSRAKIEKALEELASIVTVPTEITTENGMHIARIGNFRRINKEDIVTMTASFVQPHKSAQEVEDETLTSSTNKAPVQIYYHNQLQEYKKGYVR